MMYPRSVASLPVCMLAFVSLAPPPSTSQVAGGKTWVGHYREVEEYLRTAECVSMETLSWSAPEARRCILRPGGPAARMLWKPLVPGVHRGFRISYKAEIAAYELDKLLTLAMLPPAVEREMQGYKGSATLWVENLLPPTGGASPSPSDQSRWETQLTQMMMFDNLIGNKHRNQSNTLRDAAWNMILLDHSGAFVPDAELPHRLPQIDQGLWGRIEKLTRKELDAALGPWLDAPEIAGILDRRERMKTLANRRGGDGGFVQ
jgi:hypothetical protein